MDGGGEELWATVASAAATEARVPLGARHRWSLWIDGRWPADPSFGSIPGEAALRHTPFAGGHAGAGPPFRGPYAAANPRPQGRPGWNTCVRTGSEGLSGGNWMVVSVLPVRRGCRSDRAPRAPLPSNNILPPRGSGLPAASCPLRASGQPGHPANEVTWLILPVVICLSQRLSHACLSISTLYCETANGSLNQLSFI